MSLVEIYLTPSTYDEKLDDLMRAAALSAVTHGGRVRLIRADPYLSPLVADSGSDSDIPLVPDIRLYADLLAGGVREDEAAGELRDRRIGFQCGRHRHRRGHRTPGRRHLWTTPPRALIRPIRSPTMGHLRLSTDELIAVGTDLRTVAREFQDANATSDGVAEAVGHPGLAAKVRDFAHGWDGHRAEMLEEIARLADACTGIGDNFERIDTEFAAALRGDA